MHRCLDLLTPLPSSCFLSFAPPARRHLLRSANACSRQRQRPYSAQQQSETGSLSSTIETQSVTDGDIHELGVTSGSSRLRPILERSSHLGSRNGTEKIEDTSQDEDTLRSAGFIRPLVSTTRTDGRKPILRTRWEQSGMTMRGLQVRCSKEFASITQAASGTADVAARIVQKLDPRAAAWADLLLQTEPRQKIWLNSAAWMLAKDPRRIIDFLLATHHAPYPPQDCVSRCLMFEARYLQRQDPKIAEQLCARLVNAIQILAVRDKDDPLVLRWPMEVYLHQHLSQAQCTALYSTIVDNKIEVTDRALVSFAAAFVTHSDIKRAVDAYLRAYDTRDNRFIDPRRRVCCYILRAATNEPGGLRECLNLCARLREKGKLPSTSMANALMLSALDSKDIASVMELYRIFFTNDVQPDERTMGILVQAAKQDPQNAIPLHDLIETARQSGMLYNNEVLSTDLLHATIQAGLESNTGDIWGQAWTLFAEIYDTTSLQQLGLPPADKLEHQKTDRQPSPHAIGVMLEAYLRLHRKAGHDSTAAYDIWKQFQSVIANGDGPLAHLATTDYCFNMFLSAFVFSPKTLLYATEVMKEMQTPFPDSAEVKKCGPSDISWNIFLFGFRIHRQQALAEQVLKYMQDAGIKPSQIAWEQLVDGYADSQNMEGVLSALRRAEQSGAVWTEWMDQAIGRFKDQRSLHKAIQTQRLEEPLDFSNELATEFENRLSSDSQPQVISPPPLSNNIMAADHRDHDYGETMEVFPLSEPPPLGAKNN